MFGVRSLGLSSTLSDSVIRGMVLVATACLLSLTACSETADPEPARPTSVERPPEIHDVFTIPAQGRLQIERAQLEGRSEIPLLLIIEDEGSPTDSRKARVVAVVGKRFDGDAMPIPDQPNHFELRVPSAFLEAGLYMIEVDAVDAHPIDMRRFVVEVRP